MKIFLEKIIPLEDCEPADEDFLLAQNFSSQKRKEEFLCARTLLRKIALTEYALPKINIIVDPVKPCLEGGEFHFSISHSRGLLAIATSDRPIGVDLEYIDNGRKCEKIIQRFSEDVQKEYFALHENARTEYFYTVWTRFEALIKLRGTTLSAKNFKKDTKETVFNTNKTGEKYMLSTAQEARST